MPEYQVSQVLENSESTLEELLDSLQDMAIQYGYIAGMASHGLRNSGNAETDLVRTLFTIRLLKLRIQGKFQSLKDFYEHQKATEC